MKPKTIIVLDIETTGIDFEKNEIIEIAALALDGKSLNQIGDQFESLLRPLTPETANEKAMETHKIPMEELLKAPHPKAVWQSFVDYVNSFNTQRNFWGAPYVAGFNIAMFDLPFLDTFHKKYGPKEKIFDVRVLDMLPVSWLWFENDFSMKSINFNAISKKVGLDDEKAHRAMFDVKQEAKYIKRLIKLHRHLSPKITWNNKS